MRTHAEKEVPAIPVRKACAHLARALRYVRPFWPRLLAKVGLLWLGLLVLLLLPWPVKILIDQYIAGLPFDEATRIPDVLRPLGAFLVGSGPAETLVRIAVFQLFLVFLVGAAGNDGEQRSSATVGLGNGVDQASTTENDANAGFTLIGGLIGLADVRYTIRLTQDMNHQLRTHLFARLLRQPLTRQYDGTVGDSVYRVMYDSASITSAVYEVVLSPLASIPFALITVGLLWNLFGDHPVIPGLAAALLVVGFFGTAPFATALRRWSRRSRVAGAGATASLEEGLHNIAAVQGLGTESRQREHFETASWAAFSKWFRLLLVVASLALVVTVPVLFVLGSALHYIVDLVIVESLSPGDFTVLITYFFFIGSACYDVGSIWITVQGASVGLDRVFEMMDLPDAEANRDGTPCPSPLREIRLRDVSFSYPEGPLVLESVDLKLEVGRVVALVGAAGAGKSTLAQLVPAFLQPSAGRVEYEGLDVRDLDLRSVRSQITYVFQESALIDGTIRENLARARPDATDEELRTALHRAGAMDIISERHAGLDARVGVAGGKLSLGQKQRLALARGLLRETPVVIFDEPTSALDSESEAQIENAMYGLREDHAVLLIAHRLELVQRADEIVFLDQGRIAERGTHRELMAISGGAYRRLVELQAQS